MILEFRSRSASAEPSEREETAGAQIIIFPGIRRERHTGTAAVASKPARRGKARPKRDRLELPD
jgi:hypothetical protein